MRPLTLISSFLISWSLILSRNFEKHAALSLPVPQNAFLGLDITSCPFRPALVEKANAGNRLDDIYVIHGIRLSIHSGINLCRVLVGRWATLVSAALSNHCKFIRHQGGGTGNCQSWLTKLAKLTSKLVTWLL